MVGMRRIPKKNNANAKFINPLELTRPLIINLCKQKTSKSKEQHHDKACRCVNGVWCFTAPSAWVWAGVGKCSLDDHLQPR